jgi:hypothetical protein
MSENSSGEGLEILHDDQIITTVLSLHGTNIRTLSEIQTLSLNVWSAQDSMGLMKTEKCEPGSGLPELQ